MPELKHHSMFLQSLRLWVSKWFKVIVFLQQRLPFRPKNPKEIAVLCLSDAVARAVDVRSSPRTPGRWHVLLWCVEMHRTQSEFEDQLIFKVFIFQFVNFYSSIIYIGFFKGKSVSRYRTTSCTSLYSYAVHFVLNRTCSLGLYRSQYPQAIRDKVGGLCDLFSLFRLCAE